MISVDSNSLVGYSFIDIFAGIGGFHLALNSFGAECVFASEWDKYAQSVYYSNYGIYPEGDITKIASESIPKHNILCAGFPCQAFSISGKQKGFEDSRGTLFFDVARIVSYHKPEILLLENVKNFASHDEGRTLEIICKTLDNLGYDLFYNVLNASHYGLPQKRERIYFVGFRKDLGIKSFNFPEPLYTQVSLKNIVLSDNETEKYILKRDDIFFNNDETFNTYPLKPVRIGTVNKGGQGERIYHELGHAITLSAYGGGVGAKTGLYKINGVVRKLAPRECARLQGFPETFIIDKSESQAYKQFGNSVAVNVLQYIIKEIINTLYERKQEKTYRTRFLYSEERV